MRTDTIFYQLFLTFPNLLFELLNIPPQEGYQFTSQEIKELARSFDGIFMPPKKNTEKPIYFVEVQFQDKPDFWWRFLTEIFCYFGQYQPPNDWLAVALFARQKFDPGLPFQYQCFIDSGKIKIFYLDELDLTETSSLGLDVISLIVGSDKQAIPIAQKAAQQTKQNVLDAVERTKILELIETVLVYKLKNITREEIEAMFTLDELKETRYFKDVAADFEQKGEIKGQLKTVPLLIQLGLSAEEIATRLNLPLDAVKQAAENLS